MATRGSSTRFVGLDTVALLELVRAGDRDAYGELFERYQGFAHKVARRSSRRHADDLVSEAFRRVLTAIDHGAGPTQAFGPYLAATIRSAAAGLAAPYQEVELDVSNLLSDDPADVDPRVSTAYLSLPEPWQNALWYSDVEGMSPRHAAPLLGLPSANAFSALRTRARAGLRSAYLTQVVDGACNEHVRRHLQLLMDGAVSAEVVDQLVDDHLAECDECAAIAWRVAAVTGNRVGLVLAPAILAFHGFAISGALLPAGLGMTGFLGWLWRLPRAVAASAGTAAVGAVVVGSLVVGAALRDGPAGEDVPSFAVASSPASTTSTPATTSTPSTSSGGGDDAAGPAVASTGGATPVPVPTSSTSTPALRSTSSTSVTAAGGSTTSSVPAMAAPTATTSPVGASIATTTTTPTGTTTVAAGTTTTPTMPTSTAATTSVPTTTTTVTTTTTTTTSAPPTTTTTATTTTTTAPVVPPGDLVIDGDQTIGSGTGAKRRIEVRVTALTGAPGSVAFSAPIEQRYTIVNADCALGATVCQINPDGLVAPDEVALDVRFRSDQPVTIELRAADDSIVGIYTSS